MQTNHSFPAKIFIHSPETSCPVPPDENAMRMGGASKVFSSLWLYEYYGRTGWENGNLICNQNLVVRYLLVLVRILVNLDKVVSGSNSAISKLLISQPVRNVHTKMLIKICSRTARPICLRECVDKYPSHGRNSTDILQQEMSRQETRRFSHQLSF